MVYSTHHIKLPHSNASIRTINGSVVGSGVGAVLLDGGKGGQSSYNSIDEYIETTKTNPYAAKPKGKGLADKIGNKLSKLNLSKEPLKVKRKNIVMSL
jgi:hypothetical protein